MEEQLLSGWTPENVPKQKKPTIGERRVRTTFNPSSIDLVSQFKNKTAELITLAEEQRSLNNINVTNWEQEDIADFNRWISLAQTAYEEAEMYIVKALTLNKNKK
jgi:hypothetical protein